MSQSRSSSNTNPNGTTSLTQHAAVMDSTRKLAPSFTQLKVLSSVMAPVSWNMSAKDLAKYWAWPRRPKRNALMKTWPRLTMKCVRSKKGWPSVKKLIKLWKKSNLKTSLNTSQIPFSNLKLRKIVNFGSDAPISSQSIVVATSTTKLPSKNKFRLS